MRRFTFVTLALTAVVAFLVGAIMAGGFARPDVSAGAPKTTSGRSIAAAARPSNAAPVIPAVNFADVVERINPAVVNIDATARGQEGASPARPDQRSRSTGHAVRFPAAPGAR
jgi:hypothetical protein